MWKNGEVKAKELKEKFNLKGRVANWVQPEVICEVIFSEWTEAGVMRHPVFKGLRSDKEPTEITKEQEAMKPVKNKKKPKNQGKNLSSKTANSKKANKGDKSLDIHGITVSVTNLEKVYWPDEGYTKFDLIDYYLKISDVIIPYLVERPQNLNRHPERRGEDGFYQKDSGSMLSDWIDTISIYSESSEKDIEYMLCQNTAIKKLGISLSCFVIILTKCFRILPRWNEVSRNGKAKSISIISKTVRVRLWLRPIVCVPVKGPLLQRP